jgi:hypothetical protein
MKLDERTKNTLRIAFTIYGQNKDGMYWLDKAQEQWGHEPTEEVWNEVRTLLVTEFPTLLTKKPKLYRWVNEQ